MSRVQTFQQATVAAAAEGALVLTVNNRLSRHLLTLYDATMREEGRGAWRSPRILSLDLWLTRVLEEMGEGGNLLGNHAVRRLWEDAVEGSAETGPGLLQVPATAARALEAHRLLGEYRAEMTGGLTEDHLAFLEWRRRYLEACRKGGWLDPALLAERVCVGLRDGRVTAPRRVLLAGFDELPPKVRRLAAALAAAGAAVEELPPPGEPCGELLRVPCEDIEDEVRRAARWTRHLLERGEGRIGIVVLDLHAYRPLIERIFLAEIDPGAALSLADEDEHFSLSLGAPLAEQGMVVAALEALEAGRSLSLDAASFLLRSPYLGGSLTEQFGRARLERRLRSIGLPKISHKRLSEELGGTLPMFEAIYAKLKLAREDRSKRSLAEWVEHFCKLLEQVGWPGERPLGSREYQVLKQWREKLLPTLVSLEAVTPALERSAALSLLRRLAAEIDFQPETAPGPVQVVGHLEAAGLHFDHLWVMGLTDSTLPAPARPNPFIPVPLQVEAGMPHASARRELDFARLVFRRLCAAAPAVVLSHPLRDGDCELRPGPLVAGLETATVDLAPACSAEAAMQEALPPLEEVADRQGPPLADGEASSGGTALLKDQALCPFRAFAHHRLGARALDRPEIGLDAGTRGTLLHALLHRFWAQTGDHAGLCALDEEGMRERLAACAEEALADRFRRDPGEPLPALLDLESRRLCALAREWLVEVERLRPPFSVHSAEEEHLASLGPLTIRTQVDRIDLLPDGTLAVLDYKTGRVEPADLLGARLTEPQLPVYALGREERGLSAVAFATLRRGECAFKGLAREGELLPGVGPFAGSRLAEEHGIAGWEPLVERWRAQLHDLAGEFAAGAAAVDPVDPVKACRFCDLPPLCRVEEEP